MFFGGKSKGFAFSQPISGRGFQTGKQYHDAGHRAAPVIADIFGVSIDTLFSVGKEERAKKPQFPCEKTPAAAFSYKLTYEQEVEDGSGEKLRVYGLLTGYRVTFMVYPLLSLAEKLAAATDDWYCFRG